MGALEQVLQMREQGMSDQDIVSQLQEQGIHPRAINDALNQANVKSAVGGNTGIEDMEQMQYAAEDIPTPEGFAKVPQSYNQEQAEDIYVPQVQTQPRQYSYPSQETQSYNYSQYPNTEGAGEQDYAGAGMDADTTVEIAQQVFMEKIKKVQHQIDSLNEFKAIYQTRVDSINDRLKKIENVIDHLQSAILEKIGAYGSGIESVKKELSMMQDSYSKIVDAVSHKHHSASQAKEHRSKATTHHIVHHKAPASASSNHTSSKTKSGKHSRKKK
ncbi:MAG: hypothetical protein WD876_02285 [Candidatus Pacearchaeota archaeon]